MIKKMVSLLTLSIWGFGLLFKVLRHFLYEIEFSENVSILRLHIPHECQKEVWGGVKAVLDK